MSIKEIFALAVKNHKKNDLKVATELYQQVIKIDSSHLHAHNNLGVIFQNSNELQKAKSSFEKAIELSPNFASAYNNLGVIFNKLEERQKAVVCYERAIEINPNYASAHYNFGNIFNELEKYQKAKYHYEKALEIIPDFVDAHSNLGNILDELEEYQEAMSCYKKAIGINPNHINTLFSLGSRFQELGEYLKAFAIYDKIRQIDSENAGLVNNLANLFKYIEINQINQINQINLKSSFLFLFRNKNINHIEIVIKVITFLFNTENYNKIKKIFDSNSLLLTNKIIQKLLNEELLQLVIQKSLFGNIFLEKLLTKLRCEILFTLDDTNKNILKEQFNFIISLAEQCWLNEYVYINSEKENSHVNKLKDKIENDKEINEIEIALLGCYIPLNRSKIITKKLVNYKSSNILFNDLIDVQIKEPLKEKRLKKSIKSLDEIVDPVSKKVQEQYEEHPYPRWRFSYKYSPVTFFKSLNHEIKPNKIDFNNKFDNPNVLIAGCGTGQHTVQGARYKNAKILGIDLSLASLGYSQRKTDELGFKNIEYLHADILQLKKLNRRFDIIECGGTLHHMKDPIAGLKVLLDILEPHGYLKLGLYSEIARRDIVKAREYIKNKNYKNTSRDIKICRQDIINGKTDSLFQSLASKGDFFSTSTTRDSLFHVQEHLFTIPQISKILKNLNLDFLGFNFNNNFHKKAFSKSFPNDKKNISLDNWHQFETINPNTFGGMYQFYVRKK
tara:strand:- start:93 stop:2282 length:2190 start_codon:yes stop_codon:yes gene_type:complete